MTNTMIVASSVFLLSAVTYGNEHYFSDDFNSGTLSSIWQTNSNQEAENYLGLVSGAFVMTDSNPSNFSSELKKYNGDLLDTSGSFSSILKLKIDYTDGSEQSDVKWVFQGKDNTSPKHQKLEVKIHFNTGNTGNIQINHDNRVDNNQQILALTDIGYSSGEDLTLTLEYSEGGNRIVLKSQVNDGAVITVYDGGGYSNTIANIISDSHSVIVSKWGTSTSNQITVHVDEWSLQSFIPVVYPDGWGDTDNDGINDAIEVLFGGSSSDPDDFLTVFAAITNALTIEQALAAVADARAGSTAIEVIGGSAAIQLNMEMSTNLMTSWHSSTNINVVVPVNEDAQFFRFGFE